MAARARRHHAIEHVGAARHALDQVERRADAHQVARLVGGQPRARSAPASPASPPAARRRPGRRWRSPGSPSPPARRPSAAAAPDRCRPARCRTAPGPGLATPCSSCRANARWQRSRPGQRALHRALASPRASPAARRTRRAASGCRRRAGTGSRRRAPGVSTCVRAVDVRLEGDALVGDLAQLGEAHHLEAAGVGEDRPVPAHEAVQAAEPGDALGARPQHQMIGVGEDDVGAGGLRAGRRRRP